ncbi:hypothetical protein BGZ79_009811 [Entomortierella chlamydospora]|nr:hypothetical protein BGZ79_009811 [Entomortierella chlamydospora]
MDPLNYQRLHEDPHPGVLVIKLTPADPQPQEQHFSMASSKILVYETEDKIADAQPQPQPQPQSQSQSQPLYEWSGQEQNNRSRISDRKLPSPAQIQGRRVDLVNVVDRVRAAQLNEQKQQLKVIQQAPPQLREQRGQLDKRQPILGDDDHHHFHKHLVSPDPEIDLGVSKQIIFRVELQYGDVKWFIGRSLYEFYKLHLTLSSKRFEGVPKFPGQIERETREAEIEAINNGYRQTGRTSPELLDDAGTAFRNFMENLKGTEENGDIEPMHRRLRESGSATIRKC